MGGCVRLEEDVEHGGRRRHGWEAPALLGRSGSRLVSGESRASGSRASGETGADAFSLWVSPQNIPK